MILFQEVEATFQPSINPNSKRLAQGIGSLQDRLEKIIEDKKANQEKRREELDNSLHSTATFNPHINNSAKSISRDIRTFFAWVCL